MDSDLSFDEGSIDDITCFICAEMPCCLIRDKVEIDKCFEVGDKFEGPNNEKRFHCYGTFVAEFYDRVFHKGDRIELPACFEIAVKNRYYDTRHPIFQHLLIHLHNEWLLRNQFLLQYVKNPLSEYHSNR